ncbi:CYTOCHROME bC1 complex (ubiquinol:ferricytochrome c oxidoreductase), transmembrane subunit [Cupriavidus taiwanensis]|uniref:Cytochrome b n=1 Tax=Cupriavidus taiwanensis TaxID=164546 RepID=A0A375E5P2_9BURK|nr:cytochrome bc complex cytochrome b subunit [Cupriavidus taiwanensis]SOZ14466.1 CYTOCHROME bC1 complex (ubiquinol:ferricytochrome c oxidoreductase), transmembrane subunit [Cupriavidus taiwanensis]SOZ25890.1 CYTOCHROME bC1 complex (ubiquinol:ferricytochrome c oxidoreductase), transmembrane subunit [Cupriavidus taiwanensis]SOZ45073.1 CYTOCHROME bC1 complex (ubiquinol:ferricytochrome c oxidoreductase), transmembrane subunit [Cupriavidus taiwanensis]SOZ57699.1 CYTOCHROME bC1 complex (ubiquinol:fe
MAAEKQVKTTGLLGWIDARFPATQLWEDHLSRYYAPKNFNFWYFFGSLALLVLVIQIVTGIFLVMNYKPDGTLNAAGIPVAFASVEYIMREVPWGWLVRYMHSTGASAFFVVVYLHMFRGLLYGSYRKPRELVWIFGCLIFLCLMAEAFMGYLLPWGQMSYWGAQVIVNLFSAIPVIGQDLSLFIRGDYVVSDATLNRFFSFHVIAVPLVLLGLVIAHIIALHEVGSNNPDGVEIKAKKDENGVPLDGIPFHPYYSVHDLLGVGGFLILFSAVIFFFPEVGGYFLEANNFFPADPLKTPPHIAPVWYFTPFYSMLRATTSNFLPILWVFFALLLGMVFLRSKDARVKIGAVAIAVILAVGFYFIDAKFWGVLVMGGSVVILFFLPWLDCSPVKSIRYRPAFHKTILIVFVVVFLVLGYLGVQPPSPVGEKVSQLGTLLYFAFFLTMPLWSRVGEFKPVPERVTFHPH